MVRFGARARAKERKKERRAFRRERAHAPPKVSFAYRIASSARFAPP